MNPVDINTIVKTPNGWLTLGGLRVGDAVLTQSGRRDTLQAIDLNEPALIYELVTHDNRVVSSPYNRRWQVWSVRDQAMVFLTASELFGVQGQGERFSLPLYKFDSQKHHLLDYLKTLPDPDILIHRGDVMAVEVSLGFEEPERVIRARQALWSYGAAVVTHPDPERNRVCLNAVFMNLSEVIVRETHRISDTVVVRLAGEEQVLIAKDYITLEL